MYCVDSRVKKWLLFKLMQLQLTGLTDEVLSDLFRFTTVIFIALCVILQSIFHVYAVLERL